MKNSVLELPLYIFNIYDIRSERFGVHYVDFESPDRTRTQKDSAKFLTQLFADNGFPEPEPKK